MFNIIYKMKIWCLIGSFQYKDSVNYLTLNHIEVTDKKAETWELILDILTKEVVQKFVTISKAYCNLYPLKEIWPNYSDCSYTCVYYYASACLLS